MASGRMVCRSGLELGRKLIDVFSHGPKPIGSNLVPANRFETELESDGRSEGARTAGAQCEVDVMAESTKTADEIRGVLRRKADALLQRSAPKISRQRDGFRR
jgi:hypothetical protein